VIDPGAPHPKSRRAEVSAAIAGFPDSVVPVSYALAGEPRRVPLRALVSLEQYRGVAPIPDPVLGRFVSKLRGARCDLAEEAALGLLVPAEPGDQEVFAARLGKWQFELRQLEQGRRRAEEPG
jgi:hypothetical protein